MNKLTSFSTGRYQISRQDNTISINSPPSGRRLAPATNVTINISDDKIELRGTKDREKCNWDVELSPNGAEVRSMNRKPRRRGSMGGPRAAVSSVTLPEGVQLQGEDLQRFGLEVAGNLVGAPLSLLA